jgi:hypothetical protein
VYKKIYAKRRVALIYQSIFDPRNLFQKWKFHLAAKNTEKHLLTEISIRLSIKVLIYYDIRVGNEMTFIYIEHHLET